MSAIQRSANKLVTEKSPYLLQHAHNPVDWYPWGSEAFAKANRENKPILLSCGYSSCHWCHVMAQESFENPEIADLMNKFFINIKVDREEHPEVDKVYQEACHLLTRQGGWPLTVFLTSEGKPFYAGTYFPPVRTDGYQGFSELVQQLGETYQDHPGDLEKLADQLTEAIAESFAVRAPRDTIDPTKRLPAVIRAARENIFHHFDHEYGGLLGAPKFPSVPNLELLWSSPEEKHRRSVEFTLEKMIAGGIYDQLGGGFHRYSTDRRWLVPHFEKMLYDNALLLSLMSRVYQSSGNETIGEAAHQTADFILREIGGPEGQFYASLDADVAGREGAYYVWTPAEVTAVLTSTQAGPVNSFFGLTETGNFEDGTSVLYRTQSGPIPESLWPALYRLLSAREERQRPFRDDKAITAWNGLVVGALAEAAEALENNRYLQAAEGGMAFIMRNLRNPDGSLQRSYLSGRSEVPGFLEDYAYCVAGLLTLAGVTQNAAYAENAIELQRIQSDRFYDESSGGFFLVAEAGQLPVKPKESIDEAVPSGSGQTLLNLVKLIEVRPDLADYFKGQGEATIKLYLTDAAENPWGYGTLLRGAESFVRG